MTQSSLEKQLKHYEVIDFDGLEGNNEQIYLKEDTQKLTDEAIQNMKTLEDNPEKLIETIAQNNANFQMRFAFSKQKYIDKKEKKHNLILKIERCSVANLNNFYISKHNDYAFTREDSLAFVLNSTYPENGDVVFINEKTRGVITAALLDRISEFENSKILLFNERSPSFDVLRYEAIKLLDLSELGLKKMRFIQKTQLSEVTEKINFVVIANDGHELEVLKSIDKLLAPNCKVMVFSRYYEVIKEIYEYLGSTKTFANLKFTDYFYRVYQALPMRSHPTMQGNTCSSFFLTAIRVNI